MSEPILRIPAISEALIRLCLETREGLRYEVAPETTSGASATFLLSLEARAVSYELLDLSGRLMDKRVLEGQPWCQPGTRYTIDITATGALKASPTVVGRN